MLNNDTDTEITPEMRQQLIAEEAYHISEQHGFKEGYQLHDWLEAEAKINHTYGISIFNES